MFTTITSNMMKQTILLVSSLAVAYAADFRPGSNFGSSNDTALMNANQHPNISRSVPFQMGNQNFTFRVNVAEFVPDWNTTVQNPRVATSFYAIEWSGNVDLNDTIAAAESLDDNRSPRICASLPLGLLSASVNNGYNEKDDGDCTGALGKDCVNDLKQTSYDSGSSCSAYVPKSCGSKLGTDGTGASGEYSTYVFIITLVLTSTTALVGRGQTQMSPFDFYHWSSPVYAAGDDSEYTRESERLHVVIFSGKDTYPVCVRVKDDHVSKKSPAVSGAAGIPSGSSWWTMVTTLGLAMWLA
jgi:hypothetical protein